MQSGTKLGPYEILSPLGAGGMGEVYKAADKRLNRTVAIKVLPAQFSENVEMKQRFEREAQTIAALNHPNICTLYDVGRQDGVDFLVMEFLEGESLAQRLTRGAMPLDEALRVAIQIADALDKAHSHGVTHRDLKPGNVMLTSGGAKLLDFGLAKFNQQAMAPDGTSAAITSATTPGTILGTMQYMAPEQLEGQEVDARTDIFAFGAVLYEMVSGKKAFEGKSKAHLIAAIVSADPDPLSKLLPTVPPALDFVVKRCLAKDPEQRLQTALDLVSQLRWIAEGGSEIGIAAPIAALRRRQSRLARLSLALAALLAIVVAVPAAMYWRGGSAPEVNRFLILVPDMPTAEAVSISPDGKWIAFSARDGGSTSVFARPIGTDVPQKLAGTEGAGRLFWSSDSRTIAFFAGGHLKKVDAAGGTPQNICETPDLQGGSWNSDNVIIFGSSKGLQRVIAVGGQPMPVSTSKDDVRSEPYFLPDGRHYLYLSASGKDGPAIYAGSMDSPSDATRLVSAASNAIYADPGYLLFHREGTLYAQQFNANKLALSGEPVRVADRIPFDKTGAAAFAASQAGILIYRNTPQSENASGNSTPGSSIPVAPLLWVDKSGLKLEQAAEISTWVGMDLSPDGKRVAVHRHDADGGDVWLFDVGKNTPSKFTFDAAQDNSMPVWSPPEGAYIAYSARRNGKWGLYLKNSDNTRTEELLMESAIPVTPMGWSPDGKLLVYTANDSRNASDIWAIPVAGDRKPSVVLQTPSDERHPQVSPDGHWLAYSSNESGKSEVYIRSFPLGPAKIQVSVNGGVYPRWRRDSGELYFMSLVSLGSMMASEIRIAGASIQREVPHLLFQTQFVTGNHNGRQYFPYAVSANGQRFLIPEYESPQALYNSRSIAGGRGATLNAILPEIIADRHASAAPSSNSFAPITVVLNWTSALKRN